jgi:leukotriene-A4 hydrolase
MENPCLTFVTPTLLAGDRSLADVVAHEIAHSWSGNLVTNLTWGDFWLNEGFTVFLERKIMTAIHGDRAYFPFLASIGWCDLKGSVAAFGADHPFTALRPNLEGVDPDDSFSSIPYEKGFNLLWFIEGLVGIEAFEGFLLAYFDRFKFDHVTTDRFKECLYTHFDAVKDKLDAIDWKAWVETPGMPPVTPDFSNPLSEQCNALAKRWLDADTAACSAVDLQGWTSKQVIVFLDAVLAAENKTIDVEKFDAAYSFNASRCSEIRLRWYQIAIRAGHAAVAPKVVEFLTEQGRMKFTRPLYKELFASAFGKEIAVATFQKNRTMYHNICSKMVAKDLGV